MVYVYELDGVITYTRTDPEVTPCIELQRMIPRPVKDGYTATLRADFDTNNVWYDLAITLSKAISNTVEEISSSCSAAIYAGCDVILTDGTVEHFSLEETDQINLTTAASAVTIGGATEYAYHADGCICKMYPAADIILISNTAIMFKLYHTTYCNHAMIWAKRCETIEEAESISYGSELPEDLAENMATIVGDYTPYVYEEPVEEPVIDEEVIEGEVVEPEAEMTESTEETPVEETPEVTEPEAEVTADETV